MTTCAERRHPRVERDEADAPAAGERQQVRIGHLAVTGHPRHVVVADRHVIRQEAVPPADRSAASTASAASTPIGLGSTFGFDDTRTKPLSVIGQVAHPLALLAANHVRIVAWCTCESQASATSALTSSSATNGGSILVE